MFQLYWACSPTVVEEVRRLAAERGREATMRSPLNGMPVICIPGPDAEALRLTVDLLAQERIVSAALTSGPLPEDELWIAAEWWQRMVVERFEVGRIEVVSDRLQAEGEHLERSLVIFRIRETAAPQTKANATLSQGGEPAARVRERPGDFYGDLADPLTGGANALYAAGFEAARIRGLAHDRIIVAPPEALGFKLDTGKTSVVAWVKKSVIAVEAVGFSLGSETEVVGLFTMHGIDLDGGDLQEKAATWTREGFRFGVGLVLRGLQDPPVVIPVGSVYQQPSMGSTVQNIAVGQPTSAMVPAGATVPLILPAWCLNPSFSPPSGPLSPTPLIAISAGSTQQAVWDGIRSRYRGQP